MIRTSVNRLIMSLFNKIKLVLGTVVVFLVVLMTNLLDRQNFREVGDSMEAIYADRLVAQDILFNLSGVLHEKELAYAKLASDGGIKELGADQARITAAINSFEETKLTRQERVLFEQLKASLGELKGLEAQRNMDKVDNGQISRSIADIQGELADLSAIQMQEGRRQLQMGKQAISSADLFTQLEIGALILMALTVQVIILYPNNDKGMLADHQA